MMNKGPTATLATIATIDLGNRLNGKIVLYLG